MYVIYFFNNWLIDNLIDWSSNQLIEQSTDAFNDSIYSSISAKQLYIRWFDWLIDHLIDWLSIQLIYSLFNYLWKSDVHSLIQLHLHVLLVSLICYYIHLHCAISQTFQVFLTVDKRSEFNWSSFLWAC